MTTTHDTKQDTKAKKPRPERLSPDGKWRSFPKVPNLLQYVDTGTYFARTKINGKLIRRSLRKAGTFEEAKLALGDFRKEHDRQRRSAGAPVMFKDARILYEATTAADHTLSEKSRTYRANCIKRLLKSWPELDSLKLRSITREACEKWSSRLSSEIDAQYYNNLLGTFKAILARAGIPHDVYSPIFTIKRMGIKLSPPTLPEPEQFLRIIKLIETSGSGRQQYSADFARFLAFSGCRLSEARAATWADVDLAKGLLTIHNAKVRRARNWTPTRIIPIVPDMRALLERLKKGRPSPSTPINKVSDCEISLTSACKKIGIPKLTHHDMRHLFATRCIEAEVDIMTVSRWLGHSDGGALAMKVYGHLRKEHSANMGQRVTFSKAGEVV